MTPIYCAFVNITNVLELWARAGLYVHVGARRLVGTTIAGPGVVALGQVESGIGCMLLIGQHYDALTMKIELLHDQFE